MSSRLRLFLFEAYEGITATPPKGYKKELPIEIDDQDDNDNLDEFVTMFVTVKKRNLMEIELNGNMPITQEIADLAEIYGGYADTKRQRIRMSVSPIQIEAVHDLAAKLRKTAFMGASVGNPNWHRISARTISSLHRFVRIIKEYQAHRNTWL